MISGNDCINLDLSFLNKNNGKYIGVDGNDFCLLHNYTSIFYPIRCVKNQTKVCMFSNKCLYHGGIDDTIVGSLNNNCIERNQDYNFNSKSYLIIKLS